MRKTTVLVVDDEETLLHFMRRNLEARGFRVITARDGMEALHAFEQHQPDLIILDLLMPRMDGMEVLRRIRRHNTVPIIVLTALDEEGDKITALEQGADDYLTKPFSVGELLARVHAVLRRARWAESRGEEENIIRVGDVELDVEGHRAYHGGQVLDLTPTEFNLLHTLMRHKGRVLPHRWLLQHVWGEEYSDAVEYLRVYIGRLRKKLGETPEHRHIWTEPGVGYWFE
ncbi:MAG: response regulator transcription factor [Chloroflexi bacterium]|nr:response regulator transcription factor [Chloroflexota bacterium]